MSDIASTIAYSDLEILDKETTPMQMLSMLTIDNMTELSTMMPKVTGLDRENMEDVYLEEQRGRIYGVFRYPSMYNLFYYLSSDDVDAASEIKKLVQSDVFGFTLFNVPLVMGWTHYLLFEPIIREDMSLVLFDEESRNLISAEAIEALSKELRTAGKIRPVMRKSYPALYIKKPTMELYNLVDKIQETPSISISMYMVEDNFSNNRTWFHDPRFFKFRKWLARTLLVLPDMLIFNPNLRTKVINDEEEDSLDMIADGNSFHMIETIGDLISNSILCNESFSTISNKLRTI